MADNDFAEAKAQLPELAEMAMRMDDLCSIIAPIPTGWSIEVSREGGQPNGVGETEPNDSREWFSEEREDHHRYVFTFTGPWLEGARPEVVAKQRRRREAVAKSRVDKEEKILRQAAEILARRGESNG